MAPNLAPRGEPSVYLRCDILASIVVEIVGYVDVGVSFRPNPRNMDETERSKDRHSLRSERYDGMGVDKDLRKRGCGMSKGAK